MSTELAALRSRLDRLSGQAQAMHDEFLRTRAEREQVRGFLTQAPAALERMESLTQELFGEILDDVEANLTHAVREVLGQDRTVTTDRRIKRDQLTVTFAIHSHGDPDNQEDILKGQGGSVANILSVGLRLIALSQLDRQRHRPFLVLDEQDCWLKPELVPVFMKLIAKVAHELDIQVLAISHHPVDKFGSGADRIFELVPGDQASGPTIRALRTDAHHTPPADE